MSVCKRTSKRMGRRAAYLAVAATLLAAPGLAIAGGGGGGGGGPSADEVFVLKNTVAIPGTPLVSFDISWVDPSLDAYFLADRTHTAIDVINTKSKTVIDQFNPAPGFRGFTGNNDLSGPNGVLTLDNDGTTEVWAGDGPTAACNTNAGVVTPSQCGGTNGSTVKVINFKTGDLIANIPTGGLWRADEMCYDPKDHLVQVANDAEADTSPNHPFVSFISTETYTVVGKISVPVATNGIEQCQWNPINGLIYLNIPEVNGNGSDSTDGNVYVIDPKQMKVVQKFDIPVTQCAGPQGMAIGPDKQILLGCNAVSQPPGAGQNAAVIDAFRGTITALLTGLGGADEVWFNPGDGHYFLADGSYLPNEQLGVVDSRSDTPDQTLFIGTANGTTRRAHSVAADSNQNEAYVPIPATSGTPAAPGFTSTICGTLATQGCIAVFQANEPTPPPFIWRGQ